MSVEGHLPPGHRKPVRFFLCGDVMCGRGIDQVLAHPCSPEIHEQSMRSAEGYVLIAEQANGPIPRRNGPSYVWGAALDELARMRPDARIINLETAVTRSKDRARKGINYRMSPGAFLEIYQRSCWSCRSRSAPGPSFSRTCSHAVRA